MVFDISLSYKSYVKWQAHLYRKKGDGTKIRGELYHLYQHIRCILNMCYILHED